MTPSKWSRWTDLRGSRHERRRLIDLYQAGMIELVELQLRTKEFDGRRRALNGQRQALSEERDALAKDNPLRHRIGGFAEKVTGAMHSHHSRSGSASRSMRAHRVKSVCCPGAVCGIVGNSRSLSD